MGTPYRATDGGNQRPKEFRDDGASPNRLTGHSDNPNDGDGRWAAREVAEQVGTAVTDTWHTIHLQ